MNTPSARTAPASRPPALSGFVAALAIATLGLAFDAQAKLVEEVIKVPVKATNAYGKVAEQDSVVTMFYDDAAPKPYPLALIGHGRAVKPEERAAYGRSRNAPNSRWLASMGFLVAVPTRLGYGDTGGDDVEDSGNCSRKNYPPAYEAAAQQTVQVLHALRQRPDVAKDRTVVIGVSFGGAMVIAVAAKPEAGVQAAINFAGGGGGNPQTHPQDPCRSGQLEDMFAGYGKTARIPTLWVYTENDQWMGPKAPREWFDAYKEAGGVGEFVLFPPNGKDGHGLFTNAPEVWRGKVFEFLKGNGFADLKVPKVPTPAQ